MVEIRYPEGNIEIYPAEFFKTGGVRAFRKLLKMSVKSDMVYGTNAIAKWERAISAELSLLERSEVQKRIKKNKLEKFKNILDEYQKS